MTMLRSSRCGMASVAVISVDLLWAAGAWPASRAFELGLDLENPQRVGPHLLEQLPHRSQPLAVHAVVAVAPLGPHAHEPRLRERAQLERYRAERHVGKRRIDRARRQLFVPQQAQDLAPPG